MTYNSTLPKVFVYLLTTIETLYQTRVPLEVQKPKERPSRNIRLL
ncbi:hypothetical protein LLT1_13780, partial [Lactococcus cremoris subsp. cremoris TIFN1]